MKVLFMGTTPFSQVVLESLLKQGYELIGVITQPDRPFGRKKELKASCVKTFALKEKIPVYQPEKIKEEIAMINNLGADLIVTCAYGQFVPNAIIKNAPYGALNIHASLLPKYRGGAPIHWAVINGEEETGITLMKMAAKMDAGDMIASRKVKIAFEDSFSDVEAKLMEKAEEMIALDLKDYLDNPEKAVKQNEAEASFAYAITKDDEHIDFSRLAKDVYNHVRGLIQWPLGYALLSGQRVKFHGIKWTDLKVEAKPGTIVRVDETGIFIACLAGCVQIIELQVAGKTKQTAQAFYHGYQKQWEGSIFE